MRKFIFILICSTFTSPLLSDDYTEEPIESRPLEANESSPSWLYIGAYGGYGVI